MEKQLTPMQELMEHLDDVKSSGSNLKLSTTMCALIESTIYAVKAIIKEEYLAKEKQVIIDFGTKLLDDQTSNNGCGCFKDGGGDKPEELFNKTFETK